MPELTNRQLRRLDLTVLLVFLGLLRLRKATDVATELGLTQSAVSHSLKRLRDVFGDELFLRRPHGLEPTAVALALEAPIAAAIESLRGVLGANLRFDPASADAVIRIGALDVEQATLLPGLIGCLAREAPATRLAARNIGRRDALDALAAGDIDLGLGYFWDVDDAFVVDELYREDYLVVGRFDRRDEEGRVPLEDYLARPHVLVSPAGDLKGVVDDLLASRGLARRVIAAIPLFLPALAAVAEIGAIATVPRRLAERHAAAFGLSTALPPLPVRSFPVSVVRHRRNVRNPLHLWLVDRLTAMSAIAA